MSALVLGAGGLVGYHVARALVLKGLNVYGLVRKEADANQLSLIGVEPIIGNANEVKTYEATLKEVDVVVDAGLGDFSVLASGGDPTHISRLVLEATRKAGQENGNRPKRFIYTSGGATWEATGNKPVNEHTPFTKNPIFAASVKFVQDLLASSDVIPIVVAPGLVCGWFAAWDLLFSFNKSTGEVEFPGDPNKRVPSVHVNDLAEAYALIATAPKGDVANEIFFVASDNQDRLITLWTALAVAAGSNGKVKYVEPSKQGYLGFLEGLDQVIDNGKAKRILGWIPYHTSPAAHAKVLFRQFSAWQKQREARK